MRCRHIPHPGYYPGPSEGRTLIAGAELSRAINRAWLTIATSSIHHCVMMKYFEVAASRSAIAGDMPAEGREIFGGDFVELSPSQSDEELLETPEVILHGMDFKESGVPLLRGLADAAHQRILREHSADAFAPRLLSRLRAVRDAKLAAR